MKTVLVVEGNGNDSAALHELLQSHGYTVNQASGNPLQVSEVAEPLEHQDENHFENPPLATFRSQHDDKLYAISPAAGDTFEISKPPQGVEQHFRGIFDNGPLGIFRSSLEGKLLSINPFGAQMLKYDSPLEMIEMVNRKGIAETLYLDDNHRQEVLAHILGCDDWAVFDEKFRCKDGSLITCSFHMRAVRDVDGKPLELEGFIEDISERKRTELAQHFTQFAVDNAIDPVFWVDEQGRFVYFNDAACYSLGCSQIELIGMAIFDIDPDCSPEVFSQRWQEIKRHCSATFERRHQTRDGHVFPVEIRANYLVFQGKEYVCLFATDISERKRSERTLKFTQFAIDKSKDMAFWVKEDGSFFYVNDATCRILGYSREELLQMSIPDIDSAFTAEVLVEHWCELREKGSLTLETLHRAKDGRIYPVEVRSNYLEFDGKGYNCAFVVDITERKRTEEALKLSQLMVEGASVGIFRGDEEARILFVNDYWARKLGYTPEELRSLSFFDLDPNLTPEFWQAHRKKMAASGSNIFESVHRCKDGTEIPVEVTVNLFRYRDQGFSCSFVQDITERKQTEKTLRQANLVLENSLAVLFRWKAEPGWPVEMVSENLIQFGYSAEELLSGEIPFASLVHPEDLQRVAAEVEEHTWRREDRFQQEYRIVTKKGDVRWVNDRTLVERDAEGRVTHYQGLVMDITGRMEAEEKRRLSDRRLQSVFRVAPAGIGLVCKRVLSEVNQRICDMTGYTAEELVGNSARMLYPSQEEFDWVGKEKYAQIEAMGVGEVETRWLRKDGSIINVLLASAPLDPLDLSQGVSFTALDITDRKRAEEALRESERKYRSIVESAPFGITRSTRDGKLVSANPALASILKYDSTEELMETINRSSIQEVLFPEPSEREPLVENILSGDSWTVFNNRLRCKDGSTVTCRVHSRRIVDEDGQASEFESFQENITDQLAAEEALRESEERFRVLAETSPVAICLYQGEHVIYANPAMERLFGYSAEELCRMKFWDWSHEDDQELVRTRGLSRLAGETVPGQYEVKYVAKSGKELHVLVSAGTMKHQAGAVGVASFLDITERKRTEQVIRSSLEEKDVLLREIHHRVKNNLQVVSSLLYLQSQKLTDPELQSHFLESQSRICSMALAHELLYQSRSLAEISFKDYVESLVSQLRQVFQGPEQQIECRSVIGDISLDIAQVVPCGLLITELLSNAYKHAFTDGRSGNITVSMEKSNGQLTLSVADNGVGLPADLDCRHTTTLGLQLVTALTNQLNGILDVKQEGGTIFRVIFDSDVARNHQSSHQGPEQPV